MQAQGETRKEIADRRLREAFDRAPQGIPAARGRQILDVHWRQYGTPSDEVCDAAQMAAFRAEGPNPATVAAVAS